MVFAVVSGEQHTAAGLLQLFRQTSDQESESREHRPWVKTAARRNRLSNIERFEG